MAQFRRLHAHTPLVVALTGTDLYRDLPASPAGQRSLELADFIVVLQRQARREVPERWRSKVKVIFQSAALLDGFILPPRDCFQVAVIGHLRAEKDPFRTAWAVRRVPPESRIQVLQIGRALVPEMEELARREERENPRYRYLGEQPYQQTRRLLAGSHLVSITSRMEGSSNVLAEALVSSVPVVASRIPGLRGTLGENYPGYFEPEDTEELCRLLLRAEREERFYRRLKRACQSRAYLALPERERESWRQLLHQCAALA